ncbi:uncharacterized protein SCHCODRAFT_02604621 [Schizophyllum commune H4-8]|uniref:uncharacterized protein n=1 Tax=Schizophyllum commune (strain H4-8 / FGSC 9210) TaxID=578458 RepID=UPI00216106E5|nr:uncharacterized protein SCHCODRAFT_02604621 [Schizophyllum commune H4-8]KAI5899257.1 hypothetical protein SCHCODRAFT_02604621 [Schizophyllum commune H4-8]
MRILALLLALPLISATRTEDSDLSTVAPFIFNELSSLLAQWPNTWHPNGHSIIPGTLSPYTTLYHARKDDILPTPSPEWLAFDPEMSYAVMASKIPGPTYLRTYRTTRLARILYFNGMSAAWGPGWLDTQHAVMAGKGLANATQPAWWDDYGRAQGLCEWGASRGVEGIVRMNGGFEVIWCNFSSPALELVSNLNITPPDTQPGTLPDFPFPPPPGREVVLQDLLDQESLRPVPDPPEDRPPHRGPPHRGPPRRWWQPAPLARSGNYEWLRAASRRPFIPQPHITLFPASLVTFYHPRLTSLAPSRVNHTMTVHRAWAEASDADVQSVLDELDEVLSRSEAEMRGSGVDWQGLARDVVWGWADRIAEMDAVLSGQAENATETALRVRALAYTPLSPYMAPGTQPGASGRELFDEAARARCESLATGFAKGGMLLTAQEQLLRESIDVVVRRLCDDFGALFAESWDVVATARSGLHDRKGTAGSDVQAWQARVRDLVAWLDWPAWMQCKEVCGRESVCTVPVWPIAWVGWGRGQQDEAKLREQLRPKCMSLGDMEWP